MSDFAKPFAKGVQTLDETRTQSQSAVKQGEQATEHWSAAQLMLAIGLVPLLKRWFGQLRAATEPVNVLPVYFRHFGLKRFTGITWWHPRGFRFRLQSGRLWLLIQYYRLLAWLQASYRRCVQWCSDHRRQLLIATLVIVLLLSAYLWLQLALFLWRQFVEAVRLFWESRFGS